LKRESSYQQPEPNALHWNTPLLGFGLPARLFRSTKSRHYYLHPE
jgi:hypothetical protein